MLGFLDAWLGSGECLASSSSCCPWLVHWSRGRRPPGELLHWAGQLHSTANSATFWVTSKSDWQLRLYRVNNCITHLHNMCILIKLGHRDLWCVFFSWPPTYSRAAEGSTAQVRKLTLTFCFIFYKHCNTVYSLLSLHRKMAPAGWHGTPYAAPSAWSCVDGALTYMLAGARRPR